MKTQNNLFESTQAQPLTPMMQQYFSIKAEYDDCLVLYRLGDFYELFFDDAILAAPILEIVLTKRGKASADEQIPMCGVPYHSADIYFTKLIKAGHKLAICEQMESPLEAKKRGYKSVVKREVVRILTPGTLIEENMLENKYGQYLTTLHQIKDDLCIVYADIATGNIWLNKINKSALSSELARIKPSEIILSDNLYINGNIKDILQPYKSNLTIRANNLFSVARADDKIKHFYGIISLQSLIEMDDLEIATLGATVEYISYTHKSAKPRLQKPKRINNSSYLEMDASTRRNLEITESISGDPKKTLLSILDNCITSMGRRLLLRYLTYPLTNAIAINKRLDHVEFFVKHPKSIENIRSVLNTIGDLERLLNKIYTESAHFQDLIYIMNSLNTSLKVADELRSFDSTLPNIARIALNQIGNFSDLIDSLSNALENNLADIQNKRYIKLGFSNKLDELYDLKENADSLILKLRDKYRLQTSISNLKINFNNMLGYYIEVTSSQLPKINNQAFILRQSLVNGSRFTTKELQELESNLKKCEYDIEVEEREVFSNLCQKTILFADNIIATSQAIATIDVASTLALLAIKNNYVRPTIDDSYKFIIDGGRHPIVENYAKNSFVTNSCNMDDDHNLWLITGPNMAGKSTFLRQNAIMIIMAQMGSYVAAKSAHIGIVDKLFSRIGASDDISSGHSTFMIEMIETANILNNSSKRSFLILDEVGRGTSTNDGLAIAWSILENIHNEIKARALFATHYHELTQLENNLNNLICYTMRVKEWENKVVFMHEIIKGKADKSYGLHVAEIAGVPNKVIVRAVELLQNLHNVQNFQHIDIQDQKPTNMKKHELNNQVSIFDEFRSIDFDNLTPKLAFDLIYSLKGKL